MRGPLADDVVDAKAAPVPASQRNGPPAATRRAGATCSMLDRRAAPDAAFAALWSAADGAGHRDDAVGRRRVRHTHEGPVALRRVRTRAPRPSGPLYTTRHSARRRRRAVRLGR